MTTRALTGRRLAMWLAAFFAAACSFTDGKIGAPQDACDLGDAGPEQITPGAGGYYRVGASSTSAAPVCEGNTGSACDDCESTHCCARRSACYGDPVCAC